MQILLIFTLCLISDGGAFNEVTGYSGGGVLIKCKYQTKYTLNSKYLCKGSPIICSDQIKTGVKNQWINSGRFSLFDDNKSAEFWVMIRELTVNDTGLYHCGVDISLNTDIYTPVVLNVKNDLFYKKSISERSVVGDLTLSCKYPESLRRYPKFLCRMKLLDSACSYKASVKESGKYVNMGKFYLYDDKARQMFNVSISNVTELDSAEYWCGVEVNWTSDDGYKVYFTHINLTVTDPRIRGLSCTTIQPSSSSSLSSSSLPLLLTTGLQLTPASPSAGFPVSTVITVSVILLLLLIGISILIVVLQKRCRMQGPKSTIQSPTEMNEDYENDPNVFPLQSAQNTNLHESVYHKMDPSTNQSDSVYQSLNPNTNQSDSLYQSLNPNTNQSDSLYQSLNPNTNQSDSLYQSLNPNTNQSDSLYQSLNPNTNQSDSLYQSRNAVINQSDSLYQSLIPNTNQSDSVY